MRIAKVGPRNVTAVYVCDGTTEVVLAGPAYVDVRAMLMNLTCWG